MRYRILSTPIEVVATFIWNTAERFNLPLGRFAPKIFGLMIGSSGKRVK